MYDFLNLLRLKIQTAKFNKLNSKWQTALFGDQCSVINYSRLYMPVAGSGKVCFNNRSFILNPGKIYLIPAFAATEVSCEKQLDKYWVHFNAFILDSELDLFFMNAPVVELDVPDMEYTAGLFQRLIMLAPFKNGSAIRLKEAEALLTLLLMPFLKTLPPDGMPDDPGRRRLFKLLQFIESRLNSRLSLEMLSEEFHLSPNYLSDLFRKTFGISPIQYCNRRKINRAMNLLANADYSIEEIAYKSGMENPSVFTQLFKRHTGLSPRTYRSQAKQSAMAKL